jgi:hypothetical protein
MRSLILSLAMLLGTAVYVPVVAAQSPADGAHFATNAEIEFLAGDDDLGHAYLLTIARDRALQQPVYRAYDSYDIGQWFLTPAERGIGRGMYFWQACWTAWDIDAGDHDACTPVRTFFLTRPRTPTLTLSGAKAVVRAVFNNRGSWAIWSGKHYGCRRVSRIRMRCRPSGWAGDTQMTANLRMVNRRSGETRVSGRITYFNEYCAEVTPQKDCTDSVRVSGLY